MSTGRQTGNLPSKALMKEKMLSGEWDFTVALLVIVWAETWLLMPDGPRAGEPWRFTAEQRHFLMAWYAIDPHYVDPDDDFRGRWVWRRAILRRRKGWGKGPFSAAIALIELLAPCRFMVGDDLVVRPQRETAPWVMLAATSERQTKNTFRMLRAMIGKRKVIDGIPVESGKTMVQAGENFERLLEPVTSSTATLEGAQSTAVLGDEPHHWTKSNGGPGFAAVLKRNLGKMRNGLARLILTTNAHEPGAGSVAEDEYEKFLDVQDGKATETGILYDSLEPSTLVTDLSDIPRLRQALTEARGDAVWLSIDRTIAEIFDGTTTPEDSRRFFLNEVVAARDAWLDPKHVDACARPDLVIDPKRDLIALGFDGSRNDDSSVLIGVRIEDSHIFLIKAWEKPDGPEADDWDVPMSEVDEMVDWAFATYNVVAFNSDRHPFDSYVDQWGERYRHTLFVKASPKHPVSFDMRGRLPDFTRAAEALRAAIEEHTVTHDGHPILVRHLKNARRRPNKYGVGFGKVNRQSQRKVDAAAAAVLGRAARSSAILAGVIEKRKRKGTGRAVGWG
ncbi:terminase [Longispora fulva]|uniref:Terminase n=1 Tax=Longispora fulva TaxID=619741 RepID=A0A8J7GEY2_9ACTN|nr:terminase large subunit [Longispora fulva]MBG6137514.1 hypothetical protein [Longispora fulva]GIG61132.1 terminase [Longispora fulva]